jgi:hypothetical protein
MQIWAEHGSKKHDAAATDAALHSNRCCGVPGDDFGRGTLHRERVYEASRQDWLSLEVPDVMAGLERRLYFDTKDCQQRSARLGNGRRFPNDPVSGDGALGKLQYSWFYCRSCPANEDDTCIRRSNPAEPANRLL